MTKDVLLRHAKQLQQPGPEAAAEFDSAKTGLAEEVSNIMDSHPRRSACYPDALRELMRTNHVNHFEFMGSVFQLYDPQVLTETVAWVLQTYMARGVQLEYWRVMLPESLQLFERRLRKETRREIEPFYRWMLDHLDDFAALPKDSDFWTLHSGTPGDAHGG